MYAKFHAGCIERKPLLSMSIGNCFEFVCDIMFDVYQIRQGGEAEKKRFVVRVDRVMLLLKCFLCLFHFIFYHGGISLSFN